MGKPLVGGEVVATVDAFGKENGRQVVSTDAQIEAIIAHIKNYVPPATDLRGPVRQAERIIFSDYAGVLIANQAMDFHKQDGVTEIEEALQAGFVERQLNDQLLEDEQSHKIVILRDPAFSGCVSNFSNFLDLARKVIRNIELGVPAVVLSRSNTTQHMYRWFQLLQTELSKVGVCPGMVTYVSASVAQQRHIFKHCPSSPLYLTGSRPIAAAIKELLPNTFASTGGPNTMVCLEYNSDVAKAVRLSATIENSGQCTALRHLVTPCSLTTADVEKTFADIEVVDSAVDALRRGSFAAVLPQHTFQNEPGYNVFSSDPRAPVAYRISDKLPAEIDECWRRVFVDVTNVKDIKSADTISQISAWLNKHQPISLAVNGDAYPYPTSLRLFEQSALCVYTIGAPGALALTAQARPQEGEVFGEVPPRDEFDKYSKHPVFVPSATPGYNAHYITTHLTALSESTPDCPRRLTLLWALATTKEARGYLTVLFEYLRESCGPKRGVGARSSIFGLQRPPLNGSVTVLKFTEHTSLNQALACALPFLATNARSQTVALFENAPDLEAVLGGVFAANKVAVVKSLDELSTAVFNTVQPELVLADEEALPLAGHLVTTLLSYGHIKSTRSNDMLFYEIFEKSDKWLRLE